MDILKSSILTILVTRILGALAINFFPFIYYDKSYHLYYGLVLLVTAVFIKYFSKKVRLTILGVALGLIIDDIAVVRNFVVDAPVDPIAAYWSPKYIIPLLSGLSLISLFNERLKRLIQ